jgi:hypothetical protein
MMNKILPIELKRSKHKITPYGGLLLTYESILGLGLDRQIERELPQPGSNRGFRPSEYTVPLMLMQHAGGQKLEDIGKLRADQALKDVLKQAKTKGKGVIPSSDAAGDWLRRMGGKKRANGRADGVGLMGLGRVQGWFCNRILDELGVDEVTLDADATVIAADKEEADWTYKKVKGFQPMLGYVAETGICLYDEFRAGNVPAGQGAVEFIEACRRQLTGSRRIKAIRSDSAWYQAEVFNWAADNNALFAIAADQDQAVRSAIMQIPEAEWKPFFDKNGHETDRQIAETVHSMGKTKAAFRLIVQRWRVNKPDNQLSLFGEESGYAYSAIASNLEGSAAEVVYWYNQRGCCENWIKEGKLGFGLEYLPCSQLGANAVFFRIGLLAYNLSIAMKLLVFPKAYQARQISTIRFRVYEWAGYLVKHAGKLALRVSAPVEFIRFFSMCRHRCWLLSTG